MAENFPIKNNASYFEPGADNGFGDTADGGTSTSSGTVLSSNKSYSATPIRNEVKRVLDILHGSIDPRFTTTYDVGLSYANGRYAVDIGVDEGGCDKEGHPTADKDLTRSLANRLGMHVAGGGLENSENFSTVSLGSIAPIRTKEEVGAEKWAQLTIRAERLEQQMAAMGRMPIHRRETNAVSAHTADTFRAELESIRAELYPLAKSKIAAASEIVEKVNNGQAKLSDLKGVMATEFRPDLLTDATITQVKMPEAEELAKSNVQQGKGYYAYDPAVDGRTKEQVEGRLTAGMEGQQAGESDVDFQNRKRSYMSDMLSSMPLEEQLIMVGLAIAFALFTGKSLDSVLDNVSRATGRSIGDIAGNIPDGSHETFITSASKKAPAVWQAAWNEGHNSAAARQLLSMVSPEARARVVADQTGNTVVAQEIAGTGYNSFSATVFLDENKQLACMATGSGGWKKGALPSISTGSGNVDPRYGAVIPDLVIKNFRNRDPSAGMGNFTFDIETKNDNGSDMIAGTGRGAMRWHVGGNGSSEGCQTFSHADGDYVVRRFSKAGDLTFHIEPSLDKTNEVVIAAARNHFGQTQPGITPPNFGNVPGMKPQLSLPADLSSFPSTTLTSNDKQLAAAQQTAVRRVALQDGATSRVDYSQVPDQAYIARKETLARADAVKTRLDPAKKTIVIDSGHGVGCDCGACRGGYKESEIVRQYAAHFRKALEDQGFNVVDTNDLMQGRWENSAANNGGETGKFQRTTRAEIAERLGAAAFLSLHADDGTQSGTTSYYYGERGRQFASVINASIGGIGVKPDIESAHQELGVLRSNTARAATLVELGNLNSERDLANLNNPAWLAETARRMASGVKRYADDNTPAVVASISDNKAKKGADAPISDAARIASDYQKEQEAAKNNGGTKPAAIAPKRVADIRSPASEAAVSIPA